MGRYRDYSAPGVGRALEVAFWELAQVVAHDVASAGVLTERQAADALEYARKSDDPSELVAAWHEMRDRQLGWLATAE